MSKSLRLLFATITLLTVFFMAPGVQAQNTTKQSQERQPNSSKNLQWLRGSAPNIHEFSILGGYAFDSFVLWGKTPNATLGQLGVGYNRKFLRFGDQVVEYRLELTAFSKLTYPEFAPERERSSLSGFGMSPVGMRINFRQSHGLQPFLGATGGFIYLNGPFPDERGEKFNFTLRGGFGLELIIGQASSLSLGYNYMHLSNGNNGEVNPGVDSGFLFASLTFF